MATVKSREELIEEEKKLKDEIEKRHGKTVEELYEEREKNLRRDANEGSGQGAGCFLRCPITCLQIRRTTLFHHLLRCTNVEGFLQKDVR